MPISQVIALIENEEMRELLQQEFTELLAMAQIPPHQTALLHFQMYHTLHNLAAAVDEIFMRVEEDETIRPTAERLIGSFYINYLKECAEKEQQDLLDAESVKTFGSKEVSSSSPRVPFVSQIDHVLSRCYQITYLACFKHLNPKSWFLAFITLLTVHTLVTHSQHSIGTRDGHKSVNNQTLSGVLVYLQRV